MELNSGAIDCIWNGFTMNGREEEYTFSTPYVDNSQVIVVDREIRHENFGRFAGKERWRAGSQVLHWIFYRVKKKVARRHWQIPLAL